MLCHFHSSRSYSAAVSPGGLRPISITSSSSSAILQFPRAASLRPFPVSCHRVNASLFSWGQPEEFAPGGDEFDENGFSRLQNARSTALVLHDQNEKKEDVLSSCEDDEEHIQRKKIIEEASLATKRIPRFPGSIDFPKADAFLAHQGLVRDLSNDDRALKQALEVRRGVAAEILKVSLTAGRIGKNYAANLVSCLPGFVDQVVIEAAAMKALPEFSHLTFNARAKNFIQRSGVVDLVKWLKHNYLTYPQIGKVICLCSSNVEPVRRMAEWLKRIHVKGRYLGYVLVKASTILVSSIQTLEEIVDYLEEKGVRKDWMGFVVRRCPQILTLSMAELESRVNFYMHMGMDEKDFGTMVYDFPKALGFFSMEEMNSKVNYLKEFGLSTEDVGRLLAYKPQLMARSIEEHWKPLVKYLYYLGVRLDGMKRILMVKPAIFCVDLEVTIAPKVRFLQDIGVRQEDIGSAIAKFPPLLTYSLYKKIRAGVTRENIAKVIAFDPQLLGCSIIKKLDVNVKYFLSLGIRLHVLGEMVADFPMLLRYNLDILRPKYRYLRRTMVRPLQDLIEFPRIIPRHQILMENRLNFKLRYMLSGSDEEFNQRVLNAVENRRRFESGPRHFQLSHAHHPASVAL
ncbi:hypothetical protein AXF42_Ash020658 [Apostasia shenzhenica]|uniref:Transcription termination factor MTERF2, chloroplastic n=1 Tax=Apostasia shenzhenica TaxID=1088818 RepID=A0A2H9ZVZ9_9ASPA|nr:hypothetical protein AXF42_Ash020658 [Apostasia shenzhenica]